MGKRASGDRCVDCRQDILTSQAGHLAISGLCAKCALERRTEYREAIKRRRSEEAEKYQMADCPSCNGKGVVQGLSGGEEACVRCGGFQKVPANQV